MRRVPWPGVETMSSAAPSFSARGWMLSNPRPLPWPDSRSNPTPCHAIARARGTIQCPTIPECCQPNHPCTVGIRQALRVRAQQGGHLSSQDLQGLQFCIVDDSPINRRITELYAERWGVRCLMAEDGQQALALLREVATRGQACELAIIDMQLPGMNGLELANAIKTDPVLAQPGLLC